VHASSDWRPAIRDRAGEGPPAPLPIDATRADNSRMIVGPATSAGRWLIVAAGPLAGAETFMRTHSLRGTVASRAELGLSPLRFRQAVRSRDVGLIAIHTPNWRQQLNPQLYELALGLAPVRRRYLADDAAGTVRELRRGELAARLARIPCAVAAGLTATSAEAARFLLSRAHQRGQRPEARHVDPAVLAIWIGDAGGPVGGSVTHISGVLGAFGRAGFRIGLVSLDPPPEQLRRVVDDVEIARSLPPRARLTSDIQCILLNRAIRQSGRALARRLRPSIVYQRHRAFLVAGVDVAREFHTHFVLEWNSSEVWTRANWGGLLPIERIFDPLLVRMERYVVSRADLAAAVSRPAAEAALAAGAASDRLIVVPNGVDVEEVDTWTRHEGTSDSGSVRIGWIGSFGPWHGAEVLVRALSLLPPEIELTMIGDGSLRSSCQSLAEKSGVSNRIEWTGAIPHREALQKLSRCNVLASPHTPLRDQEFFGSPTKIFEYMAIGRPIVGSALGQLEEVLEDGRTARLVAPDDPQALADGITDVLSLPDRGAGLGRAARDEARSRHTWDMRVRLILDRLDPAREQRV
jgi:glycosyltransferase involved in cell wall biosynthesis